MCFIHVFFCTLRYHKRGVFFNFLGVVQIEQAKKQSGRSSGTVTMSLIEQEQKVVEIMRELDYGEVLIVIKNGVPVHIEEIKKSIKL